MYSVFDALLQRDTWHTRQYDDLRWFLLALNAVVDERKFDPGEMGKYFDQKCQLSELPENHAFHKAREHYVQDAWAIKRFLNLNGR